MLSRTLLGTRFSSPCSLHNCKTHYTFFRASDLLYQPGVSPNDMTLGCRRASDYSCARRL